MAYYRVLMVDVEGRVADRVEFGAACDSAAEVAAETLADSRAKELWRGQRWVRSWAPADPKSQARLRRQR